MPCLSSILTKRIARNSSAELEEVKGYLIQQRKIKDNPFANKRNSISRFHVCFFDVLLVHILVSSMIMACFLDDDNKDVCDHKETDVQ